jgi:subtilisin family serine protease
MLVGGVSVSGAAYADGVPYDPTPPPGDTEETPTVDLEVVLAAGEDRDIAFAYIMDQLGVAESKQDERRVYDYQYAFNGLWLHVTPDEATQIGELPLVAGIVSVSQPGMFDLPITDDFPIADMTGRGYDYTPQILTPGASRIGITEHGADDVNIDVGIIDTGVDAYHSDLNVVGGYDCTFDDPGQHGEDGSWDIDSFGHATHVGGIIGARDNDRYIVGAAPGARLWSFKVFGAEGSASGAQVDCGIDQAARHASNLDVVNMSLGGGGPQSNCRRGAAGLSSVDPEHLAVCNLVDLGVIVVVAAGNDSLDASFKEPASFPEAVTVSALTDIDGLPGRLAFPQPGCQFVGEDDTLAPFSNHGAAVDFIAPGVCILSTWPNDQAAYLSGTSMATPFVTGVLAEYVARCDVHGQDAVDDVHKWSSQPRWKGTGGAWDGDVGPDHEPLIRAGAPCVEH